MLFKPYKPTREDCTTYRFQERVATVEELISQINEFKSLKIDLNTVSFQCNTDNEGTICWEEIKEVTDQEFARRMKQYNTEMKRYEEEVTQAYNELQKEKGK